MCSRRTQFEEVYWKMQRFIAPSLRYCQYEYEDVLNEQVRDRVRWLDLGCGHRVLPEWRAEQEKRMVLKAGLVVGIDAHWPSLKTHRSIPLRVLGDITSLPFDKNSFDLVTANMVVEHLDNPNLVFLEVSRILRPGGLFVFHTPNARGYSTVLSRLLPKGLKRILIGVLEGRPPEDIFRTYYRANTRPAIMQIAKTMGYDTREIRFVASSALFGVLPPIAALELLWIRLLLTKPFREFRTNLIVTLQKRDA